MLSHLRLFVTLWTLTCQAPLSVGFSRQEYWSGLPFPPPGDLPDPGIQRAIDPVSIALASEFFNTSATWETLERGYELGTPLTIQWLGLGTFIEWGTGLIPGWAIRILQTVKHS